MMAACLHEDFRASVDVGRLNLYEGGPIVGYAADVKIECAGCGEPFGFIGLPVGVLPSQPTTSIDGLEARMPIRPLSADPLFGTKLPGFVVREVRS